MHNVMIASESKHAKNSHFLNLTCPAQIS